MLARLAVFWDFAQLHENLLHDAEGTPVGNRVTHVDQPEVVDAHCMLHGIDETGAVVLNRAYGDWRFFGAYASQLSELPIELTQLFTRREGPRDTYRRIVADVMNHLQSPDPADTIVIVGGGSEYRQLRQLVHQAGRRLLGIGVEGVSDTFWVESCDDFRYYRRMGCRKLFDGNFSGGSPDLERGRDLLVDSLQQLANYYGSPWVQQVRIKPAIIRHAPEFDEGLLGYDAFSHFLRDQGDLLERRHREGEQEPEYKLIDAVAGDDAEKEQPASDEVFASRYLRVAGQQGIRMPDPLIMWEGIDVYAGFLADGTSFGSFGDIDEECLRQLREDFPKLSMTEVKKVRQVLFKCFLFRPSVDDTIGFHEEVRTLEDIEDRYFQLMLARVGNNLDGPLNYRALSLALTGSVDQANRLGRMDSEEE